MISDSSAGGRVVRTTSVFEKALVGRINADGLCLKSSSSRLESGLFRGLSFG